MNKKYFYVTLSALCVMSSLSYTIFDRPATGPAEGLDVNYIDSQGNTRTRFAPVEAVFGGHDQTNRSYPSTHPRSSYDQGLTKPYRDNYQNGPYDNNYDYKDGYNY